MSNRFHKNTKNKLQSIQEIETMKDEYVHIYNIICFGVKALLYN